MKPVLTVVLLLLALILGPTLWKFASQFASSPPAASAASGLPWQIAVSAEGESTVFGLTPGRSTLAAARARLGRDMQLAIVATPDETGTLEAYFDSVNAGPIGGKMILSADLPPAQITAMRERARKTEYMQSTTRKATLAESDLPAALAAPIRAIAFIPAAHLDEDMILARFGAPAERIRIDENVLHLLYPAQGLDVVVNRQGKEILQYVAPRHFDVLRAPLQPAGK